MSLQPERDNQELKFPKPIDVRLDGDFISFVKGGNTICKFNVEDHDSLYGAVKLLTGLLSSSCVIGEIEQLRDLLLEVVGS